MPEPHIGEGRAAQMERKRRQMLLVNVIGFVLWQGFDLLSDIENLTSQLKTLLRILTLAAWAFWCFGLFLSNRLGKELSKEPAVARILSDERWAQNRLNALAIAFIAVMVAQVGLIVLSLLVSLNGMVSSRITILVGVTAFITAFLRYDKE